MSTRDRKPTLWFARHGESTWNASGLVQGQAPGPVLTRKGRNEAARVAARLDDVGITAIYTSDLERARQTAMIIGRTLQLPPRNDPALRERNFGVAQGRPQLDLETAVSGIELDRVVDADARPVEGESLSELYSRVRGFIDKVMQRETGGNVLVVTHGGVIRVAEAYCGGIAVESMVWGQVPNASVWELSAPHQSAAVVQ